MVVRAAVLLGLCLTAAACGGSGSTAPPNNQPTPKLIISVPDPTIVSGAAVQATASLSTGGQATNVTWTSSNYAVANITADGLIKGTEAGLAKITAKSGTLTGTLDVTVVPGAPVSIVIYTGDGQTGSKGTRLAEPLCTNVKDAAGNLIIGAMVTYTVATGGGEIDPPPTVATNGNGIAISGAWLLGLAVGKQTVTASAVGAGSVTFTATAQ